MLILILKWEKIHIQYKSWLTKPFYSVVKVDHAGTCHLKSYFMRIFAQKGVGTLIHFCQYSVKQMSRANIKDDEN